MMRPLVRFKPDGSEERLSCDHSEGQSGAALYMRGSGRLRLVLVCDECGAVQAELGEVDYQPDPALPPPPELPPRPGLSSASGPAPQ